MPATFTASDAVELAVVERSGFIESRHIGSAVVMAADGTVVTALGDITTPIFPRSTLKPFQAVAAMQSGVPLRGPQVALAAASHTGSKEHTDVVLTMLAAAGVTEEHLQCPEDWPQDEAARHELIRAGKGKNKLAFNCSGKHAAFLWACTENNWDHATYLDPQHPLQQRIKEVIEEFTGESVSHWGTDGCGAPLAAVSLTGLARGIGRLAKAPAGKHGNARAATVATAMLDYPWAVHGHGRENTVVMEDLGIICKNGAEGVLVLGTDTGVSVALKMLDGDTRAASLVGLTLLAASGAVDPGKISAVLDKIVRPILGGGEPVGSIRLGAPVTALLDSALLDS